MVKRVQRNNQPFFERFHCEFCKAPAVFGRFYNKKIHYICSDKKCDYRSLVEANYIKILTIPQNSK